MHLAQKKQIITKGYRFVTYLKGHFCRNNCACIQKCAFKKPISLKNEAKLADDDLLNIKNNLQTQYNVVLLSRRKLKKF